MAPPMPDISRMLDDIERRTFFQKLLRDYQALGSPPTTMDDVKFFKRVSEIATIEELKIAIDDTSTQEARDAVASALIARLREVL